MTSPKLTFNIKHLTLQKRMDKLPMNDVPMLVSAINFLLRDHEFETLDEICNHFNVNRAALEAKVATQGFEWSEAQHKFW